MAQRSRIPIVGTLHEGVYFTWTTIAAIGRARVMNLTILMPFIGYLIIFNDELIQYFSLSSIFTECHLGAEACVPNAFSDEGVTAESERTTVSRLYYLYFGFSALGLASIAFNIFCPELVKTYRSTNAYISDQLDLMSGSRAIHICDLLTDGALYRASKKVSLAGSTGLEIASKVGGYDFDGPPEKYRRGLVNLLHVHYDASNISRLWARGFIWILYIVGFMLIGWPTVQTFYSVLMSFFALFSTTS